MRLTIAPGFLLAASLALGPACSGGVDLTGDTGPDGTDDATADSVDGTDVPDGPEGVDETAADAVTVIGTAIGDHLVTVGGYRWVMSTDPFGTSKVRRK